MKEVKESMDINETELSAASKPKSRKRLLLALVAVIVLIGVLVNVVAAFAVSRSVFKKDGWKAFEEYSYGALLTEDKEWMAQYGEPTETENTDGNKLYGTKIKNKNVSHSYIIMCHQYGGSAEALTEYAKHFYDLGFNIVIPDLRGHGESAYSNISMGLQDSKDLIVWINSVIAQDKAARIVLFGVSMGANAVTLAAANELPSEVRLVIADSCYTSVSDVVEEFVKNETVFTAFPLMQLISAFSQGEIGLALEEADTVKHLRNIQLPIMFINGENDTVVPPLMSKMLYENCNSEGVEEVIIENGAHGRNLQADEAAYWSNIDNFILNNLGL